MTDQILEDDKTPLRSGASGDEYGQGVQKDLTKGRADGPAGQSSVWVEGENLDAGTADPSSFKAPIENATPSNTT